MSVNLTPLSARSYSVGRSDDPYKKYWWAIVGAFVMTGVWLCLPGMETPVGSVHVDASSKASVDASSAEQNLDSADNPNGAAGGAIDLSMDGAGRKSKSGDETTSMLYQGSGEPGAAAAGAPLGTATAASAASLAQQLKDAGKPKDASGWGEKAQRGFDAPHLGGGALGGLGSASGGSSASAGGAGAFGVHGANVGSEAAHGLHDDGSAETSAGFRALKAAAGANAAPSLKGSNEDMHAASSAVFDGKKGGGSAITGAGTGAMASANAALSAAPANLKENDPTLDTKQLPDPPSATTPAAASSNLGQMMLMIVATTALGGIVGGTVASMMGMMGMTMMQQQQTAQSQMNKTNTTLGTTSH